ncbi:hypothetical protein CY34DRAFT_800020 [Suillus luteus UH-Slu-Lm8-n1]|uniref:Uncharacterized protein n=1 Tax=Suillus luteus UH-Slu-Lm8-n1 TaxID=930992 RepID=A0A0D0AYN9_9AGAM|nr:hypothetical protein CY34DRAFT_800020 [Suillus luteus UH-Slu-Lm8-n1]
MLANKPRSEWWGRTWSEPCLHINSIDGVQIFPETVSSATQVRRHATVHARDEALDEQILLSGLQLILMLPRRKRMSTAVSLE